MTAGSVHRRTLLVAATGGHLSELVLLQRRVPALQQSPLWFVPESEQSVDLLEGQDVVAAPEVPPRNASSVPAAALAVERLLRRNAVDCVVSTGAGIAVPVFCVARAHGIACHYVESAARVHGPSLTGRLVQRLPGVHLWSQYTWNGDGRWQRAPSVFDGYDAVPRPAAPEGALRILVTLGTMRFGFPRLVDAVRRCAPAGSTVVWQTGATDVSGLELQARARWTPRELSQAVRTADVVVAHAGVGSAITALDGGACPVLVPRRQSRGEHVDDHQAEVAVALAQRGLAQAVEVTDLEEHHLLAAARSEATRVSGPLDDVVLHRSSR